MRISRMWRVVLPFALAACSGIFGPGDRDLSVSLYTEQSLAMPLRLEVRVGWRRVAISSTDSQRDTRIAPPQYGDVPVSVALLTTAGDTLAAVRLVQGYQRGYDHWLVATVGTDRPRGMCIGEIVAMPLRPAGSAAGGDSLFVDYGRIPKGAIC